jgi:3-deoxy-D-manno-octulosonate 8-phosphate phosphatase (KDO 8-P phosphatase)
MDAELLFSRARNIKLLLMDCDGVLTDGRLYFSERGEEMKVFHVRDGQGLVNWHAAGFTSGIITGRGAESIIRRRAEELGIHYLKANSANKLGDFEAIIAEVGVSPEETAFIGDDVGDLGLLGRVGVSVAVADAADEVRSKVMFTTQLNGGYGAVREVIDLLLRSKLKS